MDLAGPLEADAAVRPIGHLKPKLRDDLQISSQRYAGETSYLIEDRARSKFYRIGAPEFALISRLDGETSIEEALADTAVQLGQNALTDHEGAVILSWLLDNDLAHTDESMRAEHLLRDSDKIKVQKAVQRANLIFVKIPLFNPDRFLDAVLPAVRWMLGRAFFFLWLLVVVAGAYEVFSNWDRFVASSQGLLDVHNWIWLLGIWSGLKILHELFHGLVCKRYGGEVYEAGLILILFAPIGYVDGTASWRFQNKWQRIYTAAAGMYVEFFVAGVAAYVWAHSDIGTVHNHLAYSVVIVASVSTFLFNANPLMRFDGYYILADYVEVPNLYQLGQQYIKYLARKYLLGVSAVEPAWPQRRKLITKIYGVLSLVWRILVVLTLLIVASTLFSGAGLIIAAVSAVVLLGIPGVKFARYLLRGNEFEQPKAVRFVAIVTVTLGAGWFGANALYWSPDLQFPAIVDYKDAAIVRNDSPGFISAIEVKTGDRVHKGEVLVRLRNDELTAQLADAKLRLQEAELRRRVNLVKGELGKAQADAQRIASLRDQIAEARRLVAGLRIIAPAPGYVEAGDLRDRLMTYLPAGSRLLTIAESRTKELEISIDQRTVEDVRAQIGAPVNVIVAGRGALVVPGILDRVSPGASTEISQPALTALAGGSVPVRPADNGKYQYTEFRFQGYVRVPGPAIRQLRIGEPATVELQARRQTVMELLRRKAARWFEKVKQSGERITNQLG